jgi:hypothetical protein
VSNQEDRLYNQKLWVLQNAAWDGAVIESLYVLAFIRESFGQASQQRPRNVHEVSSGPKRPVTPPDLDTVEVREETEEEEPC